MKLIIAEKPSLARNIVAGIEKIQGMDKMQKKDGYFINNEYIVSWTIGHLFSLSDVESYTKSNPGAQWTLDNLPCFPEKFRFELRKTANKKVDYGAQKQFNILKTLCNREDVNQIINAGDADREGEIIVRICVDNALLTPKEQKRLWLPDQTTETVRMALENMKDDSEYDNLANEGLARTYIDWLYGVNLTRYATILSRRLLRVGRVIVPIVKAIYDRDMEIRNFKSETYYVIRSNEVTKNEKVLLESKLQFTKDQLEKAEETAKLYNSNTATVTKKESKKETLRAGKLFSLSTLQNLLGGTYKMSMTESLKIIQDLYEKGYLTYPRTNSEYLATAEKDKFKSIISNVKKIGYDVKFKDSKLIFDDSKIEAHSAITPTYKIPKASELSEKEMKVYSTVFRRFAAVFCAEDCIVEKTEIKISLGELEEFTLRGMMIITPGFTKYDDCKRKDKIIPNLSVGDTVNINFKPVACKTTPPKHYTIESLNNYLKNPFKDDKAKAKEMEQNGEIDDSEDYKAIFEGLELGTEATRTGIIENAKNTGYIKLTKDVYTILEGGEFLIETLDRLQIIMDKYKTSQLGRALKGVYRGEMTVDDSVKLAEEEISKIMNKTSADINYEQPNTGTLGEIVGVCPLCGKNVVRGKFSYGCMGYADGCTFKIGTLICGRTVRIDEARELLRNGSTAKLDGFISKNGKRFQGKLKVKDGKVVFDFD